MPETIFPPTAEKQILEAFTDTDHPAYGQISTSDSDGLPHARTVHFHYLQNQKAIGFNAHIKSPKWEQIRTQTFVSGCYFDLHRLIQFRFEGNAELREADEKNGNLLDTMWMKIRPDVQAAYWADYQNLKSSGDLEKNFDLSRRCPSLGVVLCKPTLWDIYVIDPNDYGKGSRAMYRELKDTWKREAVSLLHSGRI